MDTREEMCELWSLGQAESRLRALWPEGPEGSRPPGPHPLGARRERSTLPQPAEATGFVPPTVRCSGSRSFRGPTTFSRMGTRLLRVWRDSARGGLRDMPSPGDPRPDTAPDERSVESSSVNAGIEEPSRTQPEIVIGGQAGRRRPVQGERKRSTC